MEPYPITNNEIQKQFEVELNGEKAFLVYRFHKNHIALMHTEVPKALGGKGIASALAKAAFDYAEKNKLQVVIYCPFVAAYLKKHPELNSLVASEN